MVEIVPAAPEMARGFRLQPAQALLGQAPTPEALAAAIAAGPALAVVRDGAVIALGGVAKQWEGRGLVWGLLSDSIGATMLPMHRAVTRALGIAPFRRVEAHVAETHGEGHRWMRLLGFQKEGVMRAFWNGHDFALYARVREE